MGFFMRRGMKADSLSEAECNLQLFTEQEKGHRMNLGRKSVL